VFDDSLDVGEEDYFSICIGIHSGEEFSLTHSIVSTLVLSYELLIEHFEETFRERHFPMEEI